MADSPRENDGGEGGGASSPTMDAKPRRAGARKDRRMPRRRRSPRENGDRKNRFGGAEYPSRRETGDRGSRRRRRNGQAAGQRGRRNRRGGDNEKNEGEEKNEIQSQVSSEDSDTDSEAETLSGAVRSTVEKKVLVNCKPIQRFDLSGPSSMDTATTPEITIRNPPPAKVSAVNELDGFTIDVRRRNRRDLVNEAKTDYRLRDDIAAAEKRLEANLPRASNTDL